MFGKFMLGIFFAVCSEYLVFNWANCFRNLRNFYIHQSKDPLLQFLFLDYFETFSEFRSLYLLFFLKKNVSLLNLERIVTGT